MNKSGDAIALLRQVGPQLPRQIELDIDLQCFGDVDRAIAAFGRVVELTQRGVTGAGIVPGIGAFQRGAVEHFKNLDAQRRIELLEKHCKRGAHDAGADQDNVGIRGASLVHEVVSGRK